MTLPRLLIALAAIASLWGTVRAEGPSDQEVTVARRRGIEFLKFKQKPEGNWEFASHDVGITALCTIALIENGVPLTDPVVQKGYEFVKKNLTKLNNTYDLSLAAVLLSRFGDRRDKGQIKMLAARLIAGQMDSGGWHYTCPGAELDADKVLRDAAAMPKPKEGFGDNSCTQFAVLGLWVSSRTGINIDKTLTKVARRFKKTQLPDGGWTYVMATPKDEKEARPTSSPSMTGAGLFCLAVAEATQIRDALKAGKKSEGNEASGKSLLEDKVFAKGLKRTGEYVKGLGPGSARYFLWSVERVGVLLGLDQLGETDWFAKGSAGLLATQKEDGSWPSSHGDADKDGLSDTCFALLFLRKANLGSDISRLLEGEPEKKFEIVGRKPAANFDTLEEAVNAAKAGEIVRINGPGPYKFGHLDLNKEITIQAGFGYAPILKYEVGKNRLGIKLRPETDANARDMFVVSGGNVTLEGLRLQMDPPQYKQPVPWRTITVKGGTLRVLNCTLSETNKQGTTAVLVESPGRVVIRNSLIIGGKAGVEFVSNGHQELSIDNSVIFSPAGVVLSTDAKTKAPVDTSLELTNSVFQVKEVLQTPKLSGKVQVVSKLCVFQADWLGSNFLASANDTKDRSWGGRLNLYDLKQWVGTGGKAGNVKDIKGWLKLWNGTESESFGRVAPFVGLRQVGNFTHEASSQDWQLELPSDADYTLVRSRTGVNAYLAGPGSPFDQYRETIAYSDWKKGGVETALGDTQPVAGK